MEEACQVIPSKFEGNDLLVDKAYSLKRLYLKNSKTFGKFLVPEWLEDEVGIMKPEEFWEPVNSSKFVKQ